MIFQETTRTRRLVGRIEEGEELVETLTKLCQENNVTAGRVEVIGSFSKLELARFTSTAGEYQTVFDGEGHFASIAMHGTISRLGEAVALRLEAMMSVEGPAGVQFLSGQLRVGQAIAGEFVLDIFEDLAIERRLDPDSGRLVIRSIQRTEQPEEPEEVAEPAKPAAPAKPVRSDAPLGGPAMSWKDAAAEGATPAQKTSRAGAAKSSGSAPSASDIYGDLEFEEIQMKPGDILEHPKLGRCRVMKVEDDEFVHVRLPRGRIRKLSLEIVDTEFDREENGRSVFRAIIGR